MRNRYSIYYLALLLLIAAAGAFGAWKAYSVSRLLEEKRVDDNLRELAQIQAFRAQDLLSDAERVLEAFTAYFQSSEQVTESEFRRFSSVLLPGRNDVYAVHWAPKVLSSERKAHEAAMQARGLAPKGIFELALPSLSPVPALPRPRYFPITFTEPLEQNRRAVGLDAALRFSQPADGPIEMALQGRSYTTGAFPIVQDEKGPLAVAIFQPVHVYGTDSWTMQQLRGFLLLLLRPEILLTERLEPISGQPYQVRLSDISGADPKQIYPRGNVAPAAGPEYSFPLALGSREWQVDIAFEEPVRVSHAPAAIAGLIILLTLVVMFALTRSLRQSSALLVANNKLSLLANRDPLTGLANRRSIEELAHEVLALETRGEGFSAVCVVDLDNFKKVNDSLGHQQGDILLMELAELFQQTLRSSDIAARIGGDEFVLLMPQLKSLNDVTGALQRLVNSIRAYAEDHEQVSYVSASIGVALSGSDCRDFLLLQQRADRAMYEAKKAGKNRYLIWSPDLMSSGSYE